MAHSKVEKDFERISRTAVLLAHDLLTRPDDPQSATALFGAFIANAIGPIRESQWRVLMMNTGKPCGVENCDCYKVSSSLFTALDAQRDDWREEMARRGINPDKPIRP